MDHSIHMVHKLSVHTMIYLKYNLNPDKTKEMKGGGGAQASFLNTKADPNPKLGNSQSSQGNEMMLIVRS